MEFDPDNKNKLFLNCKGTCFLCLRDDDSVSRMETNNSSKTFSLQSIINFLEVDGRKMLNLSVPLDWKSVTTLNKSEIVVNLCSQCYTLAQQFREVYKLLEETKRRMEECLQRIYGVMKNSQEDLERVEKSKLKMVEDVSGIIYANIMDNLRKEMVEKCGEKLKSTNYAPPPPQVDRVPSWVPPNEDFRHHELSKEDNSASGLSTDDYTVTPISKIQLDSHKCPYCECKISATDKERRLSYHLLCFHYDHYFPNLRHPKISKDQYHRIIADLLFVDFIKMANKCCICGKGFNGSVANARLYIKMHLVKVHHDVLADKLRALQKDPCIVEKIAKCNPEGRFCLCGQYLPNSTNRRLHETQHCKLRHQRGREEAGTTNSTKRRRSRPQPTPSRDKTKTAESRPEKHSEKTFVEVYPRTFYSTDGKIRVNCNACGLTIHPGGMSRHKRICKLSKTTGKLKANIRCGYCDEILHPRVLDLHLSTRCTGAAGGSEIQSPSSNTILRQSEVVPAGSGTIAVHDGKNILTTGSSTLFQNNVAFLARSSSSLPTSTGQNLMGCIQCNRCGSFLSQNEFNNHICKAQQFFGEGNIKLPGDCMNNTSNSFGVGNKTGVDAKNETGVVDLLDPLMEF